MSRLQRILLYATVAPLLLVSFLTCYGPMLMRLVEIWEREPDYSHGFFVPIISLYLLWTTRERSGTSAGLNLDPSPWGLVLLCIALGCRVSGELLYLEPLEHLSMVVWLCGTVWFLGGWNIARWAAPALVFLCFMFPMPWRFERLCGGQLQEIATVASCWLLQTLGQPVFATGNIIHVGNHELEVAQACSGLRMLMGFLALCSAYALLCQRPVWHRFVIVLAAAPIALVCNILRITVTGVFYRVDAELAHRFTHDFAGWAMMPVALGLLFFGLWYLDHLLIETEVAESALLVRREQG